jgi:hypothetical protein
MKRRTILGLGIASAMAALFTWPVLTTTDEEVIAMVIRRRLDYLKLDTEGVAQFARDIVNKNTISPARLKMLAAITPLYMKFRLSDGENKMANLLRHGEDRIVGSYLIASDFFINGADETQEVRYLGLLNSRRPCTNPFARLNS